MRTPEGMPIVEEATIDSYMNRVKSGGHINYKRMYEEMLQEQPALEDFIKLIVQHPVSSPDVYPTYAKLMLSQLYGLLKAQAQIDNLNDKMNGQ